ncbi:MAG: hypothetical protein H0U37_06720 [Chloroflexi bacterium]|nr:hypothetical protein [Chloroflexota bacterium]
MAWFWASGYAAGGLRGGVRELARTGTVGLAALVVLWLPFIPAGGPLDYLANLSTYQGEIFNVLSLRAWNAWWLLQETAAGGNFIADDIALAGPITFRHLGFAVTGLLSLVVAAGIIRDPRPRTLFVGLAASVLTFFTFMTQMHERYAYATLLFLILLLPQRIGRLSWAWLWLAFAVVFSLNLVAAIPPSPEIGALLPIAGALGVVGSVGLIALTVVVVRSATRPPTA